MAARLLSAPRPGSSFPKGLLASQALSQRKLGVLDVGTGQMTILGRHIERHTGEITVCDPLAHIYSRIASKYRAQRPIDPEPPFAEFYPINTYDLVYYRNA